jgi:hypothetical protein
LLKFNSQYVHFTYKCTNAIISVLIKRLISCVQEISAGFLVEVQLSVHFTYKYTNAIITNNTIQHTKETLWKTIIHSPFLQPTCSECSTVFEVCDVGQGNLAISKLLA